MYTADLEQSDSFIHANNIMKKGTKRLFKSLLIILLVAIITASFTACNKAETEHFYVYGTFLEVTSQDKNGINDVYDFVASLEDILSPTAEGSDIYKINHSEAGTPVKCHSETMEIMKTAEDIYTASGGAYDPSVYPLVRLWNFSSDRYLIYTDIPSDEQILETKKLTGLEKSFKIDYENNEITKLADGAMLDFGGVAKGYVAEKSMSKISGESLINLGGNIAGKGKEYTIGIANPSREDRTFSTSYFAKVVILDGETIATSGDYERYYEMDGVYYNHIINPYTGRPQDTADGVVSCSVISESGAVGDAVATAVIVLGKEKGKELIESLGLKAVIIDSSFNAEAINITIN